MLNALTSYFRSCYQADYRAISLLNFYSPKAEHSIILKSAELLQGKLTEFPVPTSWGKKMSELLAVYSKEKALFHCSFFMFGQTIIAGKKQEIVAPLFLHSIELSKEGEIFYVSIDIENPILNPAILQAASNIESGLLENLTRKLPKGSIQFDQVFQIEKTLQEFLPNLKVSELDKFPAIWNTNELTTFRKNRKESEGFELIPACGIAMLKKPVGSRGILNELEKMAIQNDFSTPLHEAFGLGNFKKEKYSKVQDLTVPIVLSKSQEDILQAAFSKNLNLVIGPPGTGKSFTIAALAVELMSKDKTVLIASKNNQAGNVVADKIERDFGLDGVVVRAGKKDYKKELQKRLENLLNGIGLVKTTKKQKKKLTQQSSKLFKELLNLENTISSRTKKEISRGEFLSNYQASFFQKIKMFFLTNSVNGETPLWEKMFLLEKKLEERNVSLKKLIQFCFQEILNETLDHSRSSLQDLIKGLKARTGNRKERFFEEINFKKVLGALPIWVANSTDIHKVLPLEKELFDVVIIDEATQCDIASSIPILQRGKTAIIVGDPKQLRHISFLSKTRQLQLMEEFKLKIFDTSQLDYRNNSILDLISNAIKSQTQVHFLNEHYRSMPDIIEFSNRHFYDGKLEIMTACPTTVLRQHTFLYQTDGTRTEQGYNKKEADEIFKMIRKIMDTESHFHPKLCQSVGIISPFKDQVSYLQKHLLKKFTAEELERHQILIGTPYAFQGEEKEIIFISFALDDKSHPAAFRYLNREDVFNVSITRARSTQNVFISFSPEKIKQDGLLARFVSSLKKDYNNANTNLENKLKDKFLKDVLEELHALGVEEYYVGFPIAGTEIDLVVVYYGKTYCIDLVGFPGEFEAALPIERWRMLERVGLSTFTLPYSAWYFFRENCVKSLKEFLN